VISPERNRVTIFTLTIFLAASASPQAPPPYTWRAVEQTTRNGTVRLLTTTSTGAYIAADGSPQHAALEIKCSAPLTGSATISAGSGDTFAVKTEATTTLPIRLDDDPVIHAAWANLSLHQILIYDLRDLLSAPPAPHRGSPLQHSRLAAAQLRPLPAHIRHARDQLPKASALALPPLLDPSAELRTPPTGRSCPHTTHVLPDRGT